MKQIIALFLLSLSLVAAELEWAESYQAAVEKAKAENKKIYMLVTSETCRWCRKLESTTLMDPEVVRRIHEKFVPVHVTRDKDDYPAYIKAKMVPMNFFLTDEGRVFHSMPGYWNVEDFISIINDTQFKLKRMDQK